ncbi:OsmC family protein [Propylenella binzhouense]|uniref:OsmC family peroxiredoxin n=1 Tax=Propylenella binzhouense TaxID=2555902 RepID=A0A964T538_9HYPH|nr:OsmC family protein [Propylenella binzhouense]MYZ48570.1 OsmC family peroxiredoxin [Propylenella binzhouense]
MAEIKHDATISWRNDGGDFLRGKYSRLHEWRFDGGATVPASASPSVVPLPLSSAEAVDPEEAFVASLASCHMLTFLDLARRAGHVVLSYEDQAYGVMERLGAGRHAVAKVVLRPKIAFETEPEPAALTDLHHRAHELCFIANSVKSEVVVEGIAAPAEGN